MLEKRLIARQKIIDEQKREMFTLRERETKTETVFVYKETFTDLAWRQKLKTAFEENNKLKARNEYLDEQVKQLECTLHKLEGQTMKIKAEKKDLEKQVKQLKSTLHISSMKHQDKQKCQELRRELERERDRSRDQTLIIAALRAETENISEFEQKLELYSKELREAQTDLEREQDKRQYDEARNTALLNENSDHVRKMEQLREKHKKESQASNNTIRQLKQRAKTSELQFVHFRKNFEISKMRESFEEKMEKKHSSDEECNAKRAEWAEIVEQLIVTIEQQFDQQIMKLESGVALAKLKPAIIPELPTFPSAETNTPETSIPSTLTNEDVFEDVIELFPTISTETVAAQSVQIEKTEAVTVELIVNQQQNRETNDRSVSSGEDECQYVLRRWTMNKKSKQDVTIANDCFIMIIFQCVYKWLSKPNNRCPICRHLWLPERDFPTLHQSSQ